MAIWVCAPNALIKAKLAFVARKIKGGGTREDRLQTYNLSLERRVCISRKAEALGLDLGVEMDSTSRSSRTCYRSPKAEFSSPVLSLWCIVHASTKAPKSAASPAAQEEAEATCRVSGMAVAARESQSSPFLMASFSPADVGEITSM